MNDELQDVIPTDIAATTTRRRGVLLKTVFVALGVVFVSLAILAVILAQVQLTYAGRIFAPNVTSVPSADVAIVLGASILPDGTPSDALRDRLDTGLDLYRNGTVDRILITGDDGRFHVNEIASMRDHLTTADVPWEHIIVDDRGYRTYESCKRAAQVLHIETAVVVTQRFHLGRALYLCNAFGIDAIGVTADRHVYRRNTYFWARDLASSIKAWWDINIIPPDPPVKG
ncbi:YdcF family protein [Patescibacteria group bacterium]|nr:YdcF family protein [Patescibacteria group bacterium]MBU1448749.1 YdcF family protein [Patescibacteria group bacterium]MBU2613580.1 YdcF family protein [Patescibacteria group bacterium]